MAAFTDWRYKFKTASAVWKLLIINVAVFLLLRLLGIIAMIGGWSIDSVVDQLALPSVPALAAHRPWTVFTYMFTHYDPFHIIFNMLALYWFGLMMTWRCSPRQMVWLYIYGGIAGALFYFAAAQIFPGVGGWLLGASASVIAIVITTTFLMPDYPVMLLLFGSVKLKWIAVAAVVLFALGLVGDNAGAHVAHFGGIAMGALYGWLLNRGIDITRPASRAYDSVVAFLRRSVSPAAASRKKFRPRKADKKAATANSVEDDRRNLDAILDKIKHSGYTALTAEERRQLFEISKRVK
ncbi:MAG: rhomboid family intramembrane serine protease [Bacteroidales bacterium]|nr:rhomboid family intramembrane serine protease [Bacteroidales bacterium]MBD5235437.1 rhomboid family intramembrane serine protease [Barnesiella sp.]